MKLNGLLDLELSRRTVSGLVAALQTDKITTAPLGIYHTARPFVTALLAQAVNAPLVVLTARSSRARQWVDELRVWLPDAVPVHSFADPDALPYERIGWAAETRQRRIESLTSLVTTRADDARAPIVVASARALMQVTLPLRELRGSLRMLHQGQAFDFNRLLTTWVGWAYDSVSVVETPGQFSRRGGIVDVWPPNLRRPLRIELFGDEIDSLRTFDPSTQRTIDRVTQAWVGPASEALPKLGERVADRLQALDFSTCHPPAQNEFQREISQLVAGSGFRSLEWYLPYLYTQPACLLDYVPAGGFLLLDDAAELIAQLEDLEGQTVQLARDLIAAGDMPANSVPPFFQAARIREHLAAAKYLNLGSSELDGYFALEATPEHESESLLSESFVAGSRFGGEIRTAAKEIQRELHSGSRIIIVTRQSQRLAELLNESGHAIAPSENVPAPPPPGLTLVQGVMEEGWQLRDGAEGGLWFLTDAEVFGWGRPKPRRPRRTRAIAPEVFFADVTPGDYVVHMEHGIGCFTGLVRMTLDGIEREYLQVDYAQSDRLFVPVHQADRLARYVGAGAPEPALNRLGTSDWEQVKARAQRAVAEIADDLLELYAAREVVRGHAFGPDATWQAELEASFPYVETEDQLVAIEAVKHDMEQPRPMDRLICGDVGYGKTEVALRAAFKAMMDGKQVAVLVPTTVLAQQHYTNFSRRLAAFPVKVEMLSRFQTPSQQDSALSGLANGSVDMVIGTHRLLSKDVAFRDLGLLIVDEEQRFGVSHKERIKQMRTEVDVLTLTATPIPRTLHMSLTGVRDLSTIDTPPEERLPVKTFVGDFDESLIRQAILRELDRGGQVYFVHNRVQGIEQMAARVQKIVPEAHVAIGHGQMPEKELSTVMLAFAEGEYDILVCTSIIESGLDIPNVNTIIINRADQFGLAQLYQLRGRVGRSASRAYAYLLVDKYKALTLDARRRLEAIEEASDLGAGFRVAMQDLEIRGAGELLGARQHGHIAAVGFDLYARLLAQAVQEARERARSVQVASGDLSSIQDQAERETHNLLEDPIAPTVTLDLSLPARIPERYVPDPALRLQLYRRLAGLTSAEMVEEMAQEFADRFGAPPEEVQNLLYVMRVKVLAVNAAVEAINHEEGQLLIRCVRLETLDRRAMQERLTSQGIPARVARRAIWLGEPSTSSMGRNSLNLQDDDVLRRQLLATLEAIR